jgi:AcrR family transcriptional regulator
MSARAPVRACEGSATVRRSRPARGEAPRARVVEIQRARLLGAALRAVDELGYARTTVAHVTGRARVSRRTFYDLFENREDCLLAALESVVEQLRGELAGLDLEGLAWRERVRTGLWTILSFFDREPVLARVCVVQALRGGPRVLERRERVLAELAGVINAGCGEGARGTDCSSLTAEGLVGAAFAVVYGRLLRGGSEPLTGLHGDLMGMIVLPYRGAAVARRERDRPAPVVLAGLAVSSGAMSPGTVSGRSGDGNDVLAGLPIRLTYRTARVLETIAAQPGVSNRQAGELAGVSDQGQISKLLARLDRLGLIANTGEGHVRGERNAWTLTQTGTQVTQSIRSRTPDREGVSSR